MPGSEIILQANNISKKYFKNTGSSDNKQSNEFWALRNVSFNLHKGEILGVIGQNGAGKSTLLKILSEIVPPTEGSITYDGNILSILDIGTGFHPDLSGYENIFLNSALLGTKKKETLTKIPDIIAFSGIGEFIHEPIKNYSSGMYLRLALSIALFTDNTILLIDEVISSGDAEFRLKAIHKIKELSAYGRSCILISHDLDSILSLCDHCILMEKGSIANSGKPKLIVESYLSRINNNVSNSTPAKTEHDKCRFISISCDKESYYMNEAITIKIQLEKRVPEDIDIVLKVRNSVAEIMSDCEIYRPDSIHKNLPPGIYETICTIPANLFNNGNYFVDILIGDKISSIITLPYITKFTVKLPEWERDKKWNEANDNIPFRPICNWETTHIG